VVVLGAEGGLLEGSLSSFLLSRAGRGEYVALDLGTLAGGLARVFGEDAGDVLGRHLHGAFLSHPHFDHVAGLIIGSPEITKLTVHGLPPTLEALRLHAFSGSLWANFTDEGPGAIGRLHLSTMTPGTPVFVPAAGLRVEALPLSHGGTTSTAFLVEADDAALLYLGDTGPDAVEREGRLAALWQRVAPLVADGRLRAIFIEVSFPDPRDEKLLFGHLTPRWLIQELDVLAALVPSRTLRGLNVVVTHVKPSLERGVDVRKLVREQLRPLDERGVRVWIAASGERLSF
jgi:3',5'-cyclic-nucleotide phosphodiesterase